MVSASPRFFGHFLEADEIRQHCGAFTVAWAAELLQDDALAARLVTATQQADRRQMADATREWLAAIAALREWHQHGAGAGFVSFVFAVNAFYGALLAHDTLLQMRLCHDFRAQCSALFPNHEHLPLQLPTATRHQEGTRL